MAHAEAHVLTQLDKHPMDDEIVRAHIRETREDMEALDKEALKAQWFLYGYWAGILSAVIAMAMSLWWAR